MDVATQRTPTVPPAVVYTACSAAEGATGADDAAAEVGGGDVLTVAGAAAPATGVGSSGRCGGAGSLVPTEESDEMVATVVVDAASASSTS
jgi:hypothetical protein